MHVTIAPRTRFQLKNPVIAASGTFGYGVEFAARADLSEIGGIICKGTTRYPRTGNEPLRVLETPAGMLNAIGLNNIGVEAVIREKAPTWATWAVPVLVNVSGTSVSDYVEIVALLDGIPGVAGIELNISCPNVKEGGVMFGTDPRLAGEVTRAVRAVTSLPLIVKLSPNTADIQRVASAVEEAGADAVSLINTLYGMGIDIRNRRPALTNVSGGLSGPAVKPHALYLVYQVAQVVSLPVIGVGGIMTHEDALEFMLAGATAIQLGTALWLDPTCWRDIVSGLQKWCRREGVRELTEIVGAANPAYRGTQRNAGESLTGAR